MNIHGKSIRAVASNAGLSGSMALTGIGIEALSHNPITLFGGGLVAYVCWKYSVGEKLFELKKQISEHKFDDVQVKPVPTVLASTAQRSTVGANALMEPLPNEMNEHDDLVQLGVGYTLDLDVDALLAQRIGIFGVSGAGKSNTVAVLLEELAGHGVPLVVFDTEDENEALCNKPYFINPLHVTNEQITPKNAKDFGQQIMDYGLQVVVNLQSYETDEEAALVMIGIVDGINAWEEALPNGDRVPCEIVLDEASYWLPQNASESMLAKIKCEDGATMLAKLQQCFFRKLVRRGRKRGMGFTFATQRPAELDKRAISCQWLILHRQTLPNDLKVYAELGVEDDLVLALGRGEAFIIAPDGATKNYQIRARRSPDGGATPGKRNLEHYKNSRSSGRFSMSLLDAYPSQSYESPGTAQDRDRDDDISSDYIEDGAVPDRAEMVLNEPESVVPDSNTLVPNWGPNDKQFTPAQAQEFLARYRKKPTGVKEILRQMDDGKGGIGLGNGYSKYAGWLLRMTGEVR